MILVSRIIQCWLPGGETCRPAYGETFEAKSLQLSLTAYCLAHTVLNIRSRLRLTDACYPVVDLPCRDGILTRWNYRPGSAAHPNTLPNTSSKFNGRPHAPLVRPQNSRNPSGHSVSSDY